MPPRAFPYALKNIGKGEKEGLPLTRFLSKVLTWPEVQYFRGRFGEDEAAFKDIDKVSRFLAGRWAAKEACRKACTHMGKSNGMHHIMILPISTHESEETGLSSAPRALILRDYLPPYETVLEPPPNDTEEGPARRMGALEGRPFFNINNVDGQFCEISISHDNEFAQAVALVPHVEWAKNDEKHLAWDV